MNVKMKHLFPSLKSRHTFFGFHRVYGMQNNHLNLTHILAETVWKTVQRSYIYLRIDMQNQIREAQFSLSTVHRILRCFSKNDREIEIEPVILHTINPLNSIKWVTTFSWIFHFLLNNFPKKIFDIFSEMPDGFRVCGTMCNVKKEENLFWGESQFPSQNARTKVRLLYLMREKIYALTDNPSYRGLWMCVYKETKFPG